ncbi:MAG: membrane lipoprotein lipid attachment site-containing protein [bacterium]
MKKIILVLVFLIGLTGCASSSKVHYTLQEFYEEFANDSIDNFTFDFKEYSNGTIKDKYSIKTEGDKYYQTRFDEELYYYFNGVSHAKYTFDKGEWLFSLVYGFNDFLPSTLLKEVIPSDIEVDDFYDSNGTWMYQVNSSNTFYESTITYTINISIESIVIEVNEEKVTTSGEVTTVKLRDAKIYNIGKTSVTLPEIEV